MPNKKVQPKKAVAKQVDLEESIEEVVKAVEPTETTKDWKHLKSLEPVKPQWEYRDRTYVLKTGKSPLLYTLPSKHSQRKPLLWFDKEKGEQRWVGFSLSDNVLIHCREMLDLPLPGHQEVFALSHQYL